MHSEYDVIVIGGGHAGIEAAWAAAGALDGGGGIGAPGGSRSGSRVALITMNPAAIGRMSCNPAIGGLAKGQMVREIDAMGGLMGRAIDASGIMFKMLNASKGPAVRGPRAQADKEAYAAEVQALLAQRSSITVIASLVDDLLVEDGCVRGVRLPAGAGVVRPDARALERHHRCGAPARPIYPEAPEIADRSNESLVLRADAVVLTTGTFMRGLMHTGETKTPGGRAGEGAANGISGMLARLGFELGRLKTGTPPRLHRDSIDWSALEPQEGDADPLPFSFESPEVLPAGRFPVLPQILCHLSTTTPEAHDLIRGNLHRAPMYAGEMEAECGPRYCPSIEDKVVRFADREGHQVFLEPETLHCERIYCNGISTSLPAEVQDVLVRTMPGCGNAKILQYGYAVEYDMVWPHQIDATGMTKRVAGLFLAGQINCTTGYEEAAAQGLVAGLNAAQFVRGAAPVRLGRDEALIGVLMDDLVTKTPREPYRMFTSRAEHRLHLRADNADRRLTERAAALGLISQASRARFTQREAVREELLAALARGRAEGRPLSAWLMRPEVTIDEIAARLGRGERGAERRRLEEVVTDLRYAPYLARQQAEVRRQREWEERLMPAWLRYQALPGLRAEAADVLERFRPATMGQASRLAGVNPADLSLVAVAIRRGPAAGERVGSAPRA